MGMDQEDMSKLLAYYRFLFPHQFMAMWLSYSDKPQKSNLNKREFSYTVLYEQQQIYARYQIIRNSDDLLQQTTKEGQIPIKIDIGAFFQSVPKKNMTNKPIAKQLVIDIDINDYDQVRTCCQGKQCCKKCWKFMGIAINLLKTCFEEDFGYSNFLCVFSGRRGVHLWVCDESALNLQVAQRRAIMSYLKLISGNQAASTYLQQNTIRQEKIQNPKVQDKQRMKHLISQAKFPPMVNRAIQFLKPYFHSVILQQQKALQSQRCRSLIYKIIRNRNSDLAERIRIRWNQKPDWRVLLEEIDKYERNNSSFYKRFSFIEEQIILTFLYPRLDIEVSVQMHHLLKSPFSVHPDTKKVSIPISLENVMDFDPQNSITLDQLIKQIEDMGALEVKNPKIAKQTSLRQSVQILQQHALRCRRIS